MNNVKLYHLVAVRNDGKHVHLTRWPMPHKQCCTMKSKQSRYTQASTLFVETGITDEEFKTLPDWLKEDIANAA